MIAFNVGYGNYISIIDLAKIILKKTGSNSRIIYEKERPGDMKHSYSSVVKLNEAGWKPEMGFEEGLILTIDYFKS